MCMGTWIHFSERDVQIRSKTRKFGSLQIKPFPESGIFLPELQFCLLQNLVLLRQRAILLASALLGSSATSNIGGAALSGAT